MKQVLKYAAYILLILLAGYLIWRFSFIIGWVLAAAVLSFVGHPLVRYFDRLHIKKFKMPHAASAFMALMVIVVIILGLLAVFIPLIINQAETISKIDVSGVAQNFQGQFLWVENKLHEFGAIPNDISLQDFAVEKIKNIVNVKNIGGLISAIISVAGNIFVGLFSILFIAFFFLKDETLFEEAILLITPESNHEATRNVISESKNLLMRYFIGIFLESIIVMSLITLGLKIFGIKNALLIGFFGGIMNIIPYLGPVIGSVIGISLGITTSLALGVYTDVLPQTLKLVGVFAVANFIDNNVLIPIIYSKSVKSHPLEIFFVIIIGGGIAGLPGMLLAVPVYTILRVIGKEFFVQLRIVKKLTESIDTPE